MAMKPKMKAEPQDTPGMATVMAEVFKDLGDDFMILRDDSGVGTVVVKSAEAMEALEAGIKLLRQRKESTGSYKR